MTRILVVDDDLQLREMLRQMLEQVGYEIIDAPNGKVALDLYRESPTDLIITDLIMPEKEGIETIIELRREFPDARIIAISGGGRFVTEDYLYIARKLGALHTLSKPFKRQDMLDAVADVLSR